MIPTSALPDVGQLTTARHPGNTYKLDLAGGRIAGMTDGLQAVTQMVYKTLLTERYAHLIYNWDYGVELEQYMGADFDFIAADIGQSITDALLVDDRVISVQDFSVRKTGVDSLTVSFVVSSTEGDADIRWEMKL